MKNFFKKIISKNSVDKKVEEKSKVYNVGDYDATFNIPRAVLKLVGLRVTRNDSFFVRVLWSIFYWFEFSNLFIVTWLELANIVQAAKRGTFQEIFSMMPCFGYVLLAMSKSYMIEVHRPVYENLVSELRDMWPGGEVSDAEHEVIGTALRQLNYVTKAMSKSYMIEVHRPVYENLVSELRDMWPGGEVSDAEHEVIGTALRQLKYVTKGYYWCNNALLVVFLCPPFVALAKMWLGYEGRYILPFFYWFPFDPFQHGYAVILIAQTWHGLITIWFMLSGDLLFCIFLSHITTQFDLLSVRIQRLVYVDVDKQLVDTYPLGEYCKSYEKNHKHIVDSFNDNDWGVFHKQELKEIILRHHALIRLAGDVENMFSFSLVVNFFNSSIIICFCGFCCIIVEKWNELVYKSFLTTALSQTWLLCWYGQRLLESSARVSDALYKCGWYKASQSIKGSILIMLHRSQKDIHVTTYGFSIISLSSYTTIIKTSWSYFTLLLNIYKY